MTFSPGVNLPISGWLSPEEDRRDEVEAHESQRRLEALGRLTPSFFYVLDFASKRPRYENRSLAEALGYDADQIRTLGDRLIPSVTHPQDLAAVVDRWAELEALTDGAHIEYTRRLRDAAGTYRWFATRETIFKRNAAGGPTEVLGTAWDVSALKEAERRVDELARVDPTTGLPNQRVVRERLDQLFAEGVRGRAFGVLMIDLDQWKRLADTWGPAAADRALVAAAKLLRGNIRKTDLVGRYGADEFCILLPDIKPGPAMALAEKLRRSLGRITDPCPVTATFGVCCFDASTPNAAALMNAAERAVGRGKQMGRNRVELANG
jgi:diguanylate cyclase (GGDEF)-like protein/PAS domain S-box-containing protein